MLAAKFITENLEKTLCYRCGKSMGGAKFVPVTEAPMAWIAYAVCPVCQAESMVTITPTGNGIVPVQSDLAGWEFKKFIGAKTVGLDEVLNLHLALKKETIWSLLQKKEKNSEKQIKA